MPCSADGLPERSGKGRVKPSRRHERSAGKHALHLQGADCSSAAEHDIAAEFAVPRRAIVFAEGAPASTVYEIVDGLVILSKNNIAGARQVVQILGPGAWFGMSSGEVHHCSAQCLTAARLVHYESRAVARSQPLQDRLFLILPNLLQY